MSKRRAREDVNQRHLTLYWAAVQKVEVTPDKAPLSVCDSTVTAGCEYPMAVNIPSVMTNSTADDSNKKQNKEASRLYAELLLCVCWHTEHI